MNSAIPGENVTSNSARQICDELSLTVYAHRLECLVKSLLCCIQGQGHSEGLEPQWMFVRTIFLIDYT